MSIPAFMQNVEWEVLPPPEKMPEDGLPYATHQGVLEIAGHSLRCARLNTGEAIFIAEDIEKMFDGMLGGME